MKIITSKILIFIALVLTLFCEGCMSLEERCNIDMANRRFNSYQECMAFRWRQEEAENERMHRNQQEFFRSQFGSANDSDRAECNGYSVPPFARANCKRICINGRWNEICDSGY